MSISSRSRCSITKHSGALMSSRLMPPKPAQEAHRIDHVVDILRADLEVDAVDVGESLEQRDLAFHHRLRCDRAEIAQAEHGGPVGHHRDHVALGGVVVGQRSVALDMQAGFGDAGRIRERQVARRDDRLGDACLELSRTARGMQCERLFGRDVCCARIDAAIGHCGSSGSPSGSDRHHAGRRRVMEASPRRAGRISADQPGSAGRWNARRSSRVLRRCTKIHAAPN